MTTTRCATDGGRRYFIRSRDSVRIDQRISLIGAFINLIWPVPIILLGVRHGYKWSMMATAVAGILIAILVHPLHAVAVVLASA